MELGGGPARGQLEVEGSRARGDPQRGQLEVEAGKEDIPVLGFPARLVWVIPIELNSCIEAANCVLLKMHSIPRESELP